MESQLTWALLAAQARTRRGLHAGRPAAGVSVTPMSTHCQNPFFCCLKLWRHARGTARQNQDRLLRRSFHGDRSALVMR